MFVQADRDAIYRVLFNMCDNAVKFSKESGKFKVTLKFKDKKVLTAVYNEGQGIAAEDLPHIFDRFYKADKSRGLDKSGAGLGMFISKIMLDAHREEIWAESVYGEYCEIKFTLPRAAESKKTER
jgi:signal transduction histidine kinase